MTYQEIIDEIDRTLEELKDEIIKLEEARFYLTGHRKPGRPKNRAVTQ